MTNIRYSYLHGPRRHVTIARDVDSDQGLIHIGISVTHPSDSFDKKMGRAMAEGRLTAGKISKRKKGNKLFWSIPLKEKPFEAVISFLVAGEDIPVKVQQLAQEWCEERGVDVTQR